MLAWKPKHFPVTGNGPTNSLMTQVTEWIRLQSSITIAGGMNIPVYKWLDREAGRISSDNRAVQVVYRPDGMGALFAAPSSHLGSFPRSGNQGLPRNRGDHESFESI